MTIIFKHKEQTSGKEKMAYNDFVATLELVIDFYTSKTKELAKMTAEDENNQHQQGSTSEMMPMSPDLENLYNECRVLKEKLKDVVRILIDILQSFVHYDELAQIGLTSLEQRLSNAKQNQQALSNWKTEVPWMMKKKPQLESIKRKELLANM